jgi:AcrR family transcriptional regulator
VTRLRRGEQVERNRDLVLDAAWRVFADRGYVGSSLEAIADEAGFSKGVVYSQFGSKADLFLALLDRRIELRAAQNLAIAQRHSGSGADALRDLLVAAGRDANVEGGWARALVEFRAVATRDLALQRRYAEAHARTVAHLVTALEMIFAGAGATPDVPLRSIAQLILALGTGVTLERLTDRQALDGEDVAAMLARAVGLADHVEATR